LRAVASAPPALFLKEENTMNTTTIDKAEIVSQMRNMVEERLFGDKSWPIDNNAAVHEKLVAWGLQEECEISVGAAGEIVERPKSPSSKKGETCIRATALGRELCVDLWTAFTGHHEPSEIPDILVEYGFMTVDEAEHIVLERWARGGESLEEILPPILRRVYRANEFFNAVKGLVVSVRGYLDDSSGNDGDHIMGMVESVADVLNKAHAVPELHEWSQKARQTGERP
jgi:hypothetical protein